MQYIGIKTNMSDYRCVEDGFVFSFDLNGVGFGNDGFLFKLGLAQSKKKNMKLTQWNCRSKSPN